MERVENNIVDKLVALKYLALSLSKNSPDFLKDIGIYLFTVLDSMFFTAVRHEVNNLETSVVVQELELAINLALFVLWSLGS